MKLFLHAFAGTLFGLFLAYAIYIAYSFDWVNDHIGLPLAEATAQWHPPWIPTKQ